MRAASWIGLAAIVASVPAQAESVRIDAPAGRAADVAAAAFAMAQPVGSGRRDMHQPDRLVGGSAARSGDPGDSDGDLRHGPGQRAPGHGPGDRLRNRSVPIDQRGGNAEELALGGVAVGHEAAFHHRRRAGHGGQRRGDEAAGAALGRRHRQPPGGCGFDDRAGEGFDIVGKHQSGPSEAAASRYRVARSARGRRQHTGRA